MDEEDDNYNFFNQFQEQNYPIDSAIDSPPSKPVSSIEPPVFKAFNPQEALQKLPLSQQQQFSHLYLNHKSFSAFNLAQMSSEFIDEIKESVFEPDWYENAINLQDLFDPESPHEREDYTSQINILKEKVDQIHNRTFNHLGINKTISQSFYDHFENYLYLDAEIAFAKNFQESWVDFMKDLKKVKGPGSLLFSSIYDFWMKSFKAFIQDIWKYSEKYTLSFLKKNHNKDSHSHSQHSSYSSEIHSTSSKRVTTESQKRRPWKNSQLQILQKVIQSNGAFSQSTLNKIANQLQRTSASISSKIQKMIKNKKRIHNPDFEQGDNLTLYEKVEQIMKIYHQGMPRESVIDRINEHYQMGYDQSWTKSVAQILSSRPEFVKIKGTYSLVDSYNFDGTIKSFKDKVVSCLLKCPNQKGDLKKLVQVYVGIYEKAEGISILSEQRIKAIEASISKSLCRYDIFDKSHSKTIYKLREFCTSKEMEMDIESFLA